MDGPLYPYPFTRANLVNQELTQELARKSSLEARGITIVTASGLLVTLTFGFAAAVAKKATDIGVFTFPEKLALGIALIFFLVSSYFGLLTNSPRRTGVLKRETLLRSAGGTPDESISEKTLGELVDVLETARTANKDKAGALLICMTLQVIAVLILGITVVLVVI
jgi:hypothetical protein